MGLLANFKIRTKLFIALLPLAVMVIVATLYSSIEMKRIDTWYSNLIYRDVRLILDLRFRAVCFWLSNACTVQIGTLRFYLPPKSQRKKPSKWDRASSEAGSLLATRTVTPKDSMSGVRQSFNFWLRTLTSLGSARLA